MQTAHAVAVPLVAAGAGPDTLAQSVVPSARVQHVAGAREGRGVGGVLLVAPLDSIMPDVEREGRDEQEHDEGEREQDEDLAALVGRDQLLMTRVDSAVIVMGGRGTSGTSVRYV